MVEIKEATLGPKMEMPPMQFIIVEPKLKF